MPPPLFQPPLPLPLPLPSSHPHHTHPRLRLRPPLTLQHPARAPCLTPLTTTTAITTPLPFPPTLPIPPPNFKPLPTHPPTPRSIVWFRNDLRLHDHPALTHALTSSLPIPVFIFDPRLFSLCDFGFERTSASRVTFLLDSLRDLKRRLKQRGSDLVLRIGHPEQVLVPLAAEFAATNVICHAEVGVEDVAVECAAAKALRAVGVTLTVLGGNMLHDIHPLCEASVPDEYTQFRAMLEKLPVKEVPQVPDVMLGFEGGAVGDVPGLAELGFGDDDGALCGVGGEGEALKRVARWVADDVDVVTRIEPWLALGCVSPRRLYAMVGEGGHDEYFELLWRDFVRWHARRWSRERVESGERERLKVQGKVSAMGFL